MPHWGIVSTSPALFWSLAPFDYVGQYVGPMLAKVKQAIWDSPVLGTNYRRVARRVAYQRGKRDYDSSANYWDRRYSEGGTSGPGSDGPLAEFKAEVLNQFLAESDVRSVIEFGSGDGSQLAKLSVQTYIGLDVSPLAIAKCQDMYGGDATKRFFLHPAEDVTLGEAPFLSDAVLSIDVIFHLTEDDVYDRYMADLFKSARHWVVLYTSDSDTFREHPEHPHMRHHPIQRDIGRRFPEWRLDHIIPNRYPWNGDSNVSSFCEFFFYRR
jgi:hypothetical protein